MYAESVLRKHVALIHTFSSMSLLQRKIFNALLSEALYKRKSRPELEDNSTLIECNLPLVSLAKRIGYNSRNTRYLKEKIDELSTIVIEWNLLRESAPSNISFLNMQVLHGPPTFYTDATFNFSFHRVMLDMVGTPAIYGTIDLDLQSRFESKYGHALYENSTRFVNLNRSKIIDLSVFRKLLGVSDGRHCLNSELMRSITKPALEEVNDRADFTVTLDNIKQGKRIVGVELSVVGRKKTIVRETANEDAAKYEEIISKIYEAFGDINKTVLSGILSSYEKDYILEKISYTKENAKKTAAGVHPVAYFISALKHNYQQTSRVDAEDSVIEKEHAPACEWSEQLKALKMDVAHWEKTAKLLTSSGNAALAGNAKIILSQSEQKLKQHLSNRPPELLEEGGVK